MTNKIFVHYDDSGKVYGLTHEHETFFEMRKAAGEKIIEIPDQIDYKRYKVNLSDLTLIEKTPEELKADFEAYFTPPQSLDSAELTDGGLTVSGVPEIPNSLP